MTVKKANTKGLIKVKFKHYPFVDCPTCDKSNNRVIKDVNYFEHNIQYIDFECLECGECFRAGEM